MTKILAWHQKKGLENINERLLKNETESRGRVIMPTGSGKTFLQSYVLNDYMNLYSGNRKIHVVVAPRIQLAIQHLYSFQNDKNVCGLKDYRPFALHSGGNGDDGKESSDIFINDLRVDKINSGTSVDSILDDFKTATDQNVDLVVFATYHSLDRLFNAIEKLNNDLKYNVAGLAQFDECQYLVSSGFGEYLTSTPFYKNVFYTATQKYTKNDQEGLGMANVKKWGEIIHLNTPLEMYETGIILRPRLHLLVLEGVQDEYVDTRKIVIETFKKHLEVNHKELPVKLVVNTGGTEFINDIWESPDFKNEFKNADIFKISAAGGAWWYCSKTNKEYELDRKSWLEKIKKVGNCIILHYDIISEGIDVDGITGTLILRNAGTAKLIQMIGRTLRLYYKDREEFKKGNLSVNKLDDWIKPAGLVSVAVIKNDDGTTKDDSATVVELVSAMRSAGFDPTENIIIHEPKGNEDIKEEIETIDPIGGDLGTKLKSLFGEIFDINHTLESLEDMIKRCNSGNDLLKIEEFY